MKINFRKWLFRTWYWYVNNVDKKGEVQFMNYGYSEKDEEIPLEVHDEPNRYSIQLYHQLAKTLNLKDKSIVEVGCGRGGGLSYITRKFETKYALGIDLDKTAIEFCNKQHAHKALSFMQGDAQKLPLSDNSCDVVLNVESSHRYPDIDQFLSEVKRILRPEGHFLLTDFRYDYEMEEFKKIIDRSGLQLISEKYITKEVVAALEMDDKRKREIVYRLAPRFLHKTALNFAGAVGSKTYNQFFTRKYEYFNYVLKKN
ncbi:MAG: class I SAM-dependent methyltransferase [Tenuifilaceae bacterium]